MRHLFALIFFLLFYNVENNFITYRKTLSLYATMAFNQSIFYQDTLFYLNGDRFEVLFLSFIETNLISYENMNFDIKYKYFLNENRSHKNRADKVKIKIVFCQNLIKKKCFLELKLDNKNE